MSSPSLSQDQRLAWIHELLTGTSESLPYRVAGMLLLLYAQPLVKVVTFPTSIVDDGDGAWASRSARTRLPRSRRPPAIEARGRSGPLTWHAVDLHKHGLSLIGCIMESLEKARLSALTDRTSDGHLR
jgi:hypothetical protein